MAIEQVNENTFIITFSQALGPPPIAQVHCAMQRLQAACDSHHLLALVPASHSLLVEFDQNNTTEVKIRQLLEKVHVDAAEAKDQPSDIRRHSIPVLYDARVAPDLAEVAMHSAMSIDQLIETHTSREYEVWAVGFLPGFAYLGSLPESLQLARRATPRSQVAAGSVAIAENYTGIYPRSSPGGWHIIGRTPLAMLNDLSKADDSRSASRLRVSDRVSFEAITRERFVAMGGTLDD